MAAELNLEKKSKAYLRRLRGRQPGQSSLTDSQPSLADIQQKSGSVVDLSADLKISLDEEEKKLATLKIVVREKKGYMIVRIEGFMEPLRKSYRRMRTSSSSEEMKESLNYVRFMNTLYERAIKECEEYFNSREAIHQDWLRKEAEEGKGMDEMRGIK